LIISLSLVVAAVDLTLVVAVVLVDLEQELHIQ
jgi:hypothetical protein